MIRPHRFYSDGRFGCLVCPLPKRNTRVHVEDDGLTVPDITEPVRGPSELPGGLAGAGAVQLMLPVPRRRQPVPA